MSAIKRLLGRARLSPMAALILAPLVGIGGIAVAQVVVPVSDVKVTALLKARLPKTEVTAINCKKVDGLCEVTAGSNLFYVDPSARYLIIGRVYDMETRQDVTAARLLEINPDMLVGGAAKANAAAASGTPEDESAPVQPTAAARKVSLPTRPAKLSLAELPKDGAIVWGNKAAAQTVTVFTDFRCGYCRAMTAALRSMDVKVIERPVSVMGSRDISDRVYCAKNQEQALHAAYSAAPFKSEGHCDTKGLNANEAFFHSHGFGGTPVIVRSDGAVQEGFLSRDQLVDWLKGARS